MKYGQVELGEVSREYKEFVDKFKPKKTTDDCYTPAPIYEAVVKWCELEYGINRADIVRPFWPDGDFERFEYPDGAVVIDNPPFSIITPIVRFYEAHAIQYFLFAPHLTNFGIPAKCHIITNADITYENGATVNTSFVTNLDAYVVRVPHLLHDMIHEANKERLQIKSVPKYSYPLEVITAARCGYYADHGTDFAIKAEDCLKVRRLDAQTGGTSIYGSGYLISPQATAYRAEVERIAAERAREEQKPSHVWKLSDREQDIISRLGKENKPCD